MGASFKDTVPVQKQLEFQDLLLGKAINTQSISQRDLTEINEKMVRHEVKRSLPQQTEGTGNLYYLMKYSRGSFVTA